MGPADEAEPGRREPQASDLSDIRRGQRLQVFNRTRRRTLASDLRLALDPLGRLRGLIGRPALGPGQGLLLRPCAGVHTFFMSYPIDALFVGGDGEVVAMRCGLRPYRLTPIFGQALATLELPAGVVRDSGTEVGDVLVFLPVP